MKMFYTLRSGTMLKNQRGSTIRFDTEEEAFEKAREMCLQTGREVALILNDKDSSRLIKKVFYVGK